MFLENCFLISLSLCQQNKKHNKSRKRKHLPIQLSKNSRCHFLQRRKWVDFALGSLCVLAAQTFDQLRKHDSFPLAVQGVMHFQLIIQPLFFPSELLSCVKSCQHHSQQISTSLGVTGSHSPTVLKNKFDFKIHLLSFHKDSGIFQCFLIWDLFLGKNRIYSLSRSHLCTFVCVCVCEGFFSPTLT